jgi:hypothetical protein
LLKIYIYYLSPPTVEAEARIEESQCNARVEAEKARSRREQELAEQAHGIRIAEDRVAAEARNVVAAARARAEADFAFLGGEAPLPLSAELRARHVVEMARARALEGKGSVIVPMGAGIHVHARTEAVHDMD